MMLREGATAQTAVDSIDHALRILSSARSHGPDETMRDSFVRAHDEMESQLANAFERGAVRELLHSQRYWYMLENPMARGAMLLLRPMNMAVNQECDSLDAALRTVREAFTALTRWLSKPGLLTLIDTNVLMNCQPIDQIDWNVELMPYGVTRSTPPRLIVPLSVIDEVDRKKFEGGPTPRERAAKAIASIRGLRAGSSADQTAEIKAAGGSVATLEIPRDDVGRTRLLSTDDELIDFGAFLRRAGGSQDVVLVTRDYGAELRADRHGLKVVWLDDKYVKKDKQRPAASLPGVLATPV